MPSAALIAAATAAVQDAFGTIPVFSCLTGSTATGTDTTDSDIDLFVVLPNHLPLDEAVRRRETFTRNYIHLHATFGRPPDLQWPGEVCYTTDLDAAINGGAFDLDSEPALRLCSPDDPYRYWVSMSATGIALTGHTEFRKYNARCVSTLRSHIGYNRLITPEPPHDADASEWEEWNIDTVRVGCGIRDFTSMQNVDYRAWRQQLQRPGQLPQLDRWIEHWRKIAS
ncbi:nucleotidyltransferase domain-containing protein [Nocardia wallacei]|uniref:nucleotidyltransferase domain-containing protein n=1 Tax=Nocardia wallacei TaxID=480035 RepID=UPI002456009C|nr:nucleotidyltransferase domain-containing protein [Nocardia wallacei]